ncbi:hypothetical protein D3C87_1405030 [compost metagenome]
MLGLFAGDVQGGHALGEIAQGLQQNGRFADAGVATDQYHRTVHQAPTQDAIKFAGSGGEARDLFDTDFGQGLDLRLLPGPAGATAGSCGAAALDHGFRQGVPGTALTTLAGPLGKG